MRKAGFVVGDQNVLQQKGNVFMEHASKQRLHDVMEDSAGKFAAEGCKPCQNFERIERVYFGLTQNEHQHVGTTVGGFVLAERSVRSP